MLWGLWTHIFKSRRLLLPIVGTEEWIKLLYDTKHALYSTLTEDTVLPGLSARGLDTKELHARDGVTTLVNSNGFTL